MPSRRHALALVALWGVFVAFYLLFAGELSTTEIITGVPSATAAALFVLLVNRTEDRRHHFRAPWLRVVGKPLLAVLPDAVRVGRVLLRSLWRRPDGGLGTTLRQPFRRGGDGPAAAARRALVTLGLSVAPNGYVLEIGDNQDDLSLHRLSPAPPRPDPEWPL